MNLFVTSKCPIESAEFLDDNRANKMLLETAQLLATAIRLHGGQATYKVTHKNHPVTIWVRQTQGNYKWALNHFKALCKRFRRRGKVHKCEQYLEEFEQGLQYIPKGKRTKFANCAARQDMNISYKHINDVHLAYQLYLNDRWDTDKREPTWDTKG